MEERTRAYLRGRFGDYYRRTGLTLPPDDRDREWAYIPWTAGPGTTMVRHRSLLDLGDVGDWLARERPRHVYFSSGRYERPGANTMDDKDWLGSDLVFDLDADHLPAVDPAADSYAEMLAACKDALVRLLDLLTDDLGFADLTIAFSAGRGYHVHVRDPSVQDLEREQRREIVDYVRGIGIDPDALVDSETVAGRGRKTPANKHTLRTSGGWGRRAARRLRQVTAKLADADDGAALERLRSYDGIGESRAESILGAIRTNREAIAAGNVDVHRDFTHFARQVIEETVTAESSHIDEPVTTDTNRLIRCSSWMFTSRPPSRLVRGPSGRCPRIREVS
ncbi:DNA primase catalytic subunit PriS, partial [Halobacteriales archaeon SW_7_68_16]